MCKVQRLREARWQGMTKQRGRPHVMRNDTVSAPFAASRRALHVRHAPNQQRLSLISTTPAQYPVPTKREALIEVDLIRVSHGLFLSAPYSPGCVPVCVRQSDYERIPSSFFRRLFIRESNPRLRTTAWKDRAYPSAVLTSSRIMSRTCHCSSVRPSTYSTFMGMSL